MPPRTVEFVTDRRFVKRKTEVRTIEAMVGMYCRHHHPSQKKDSEGLCAECAELLAYARRRLERCVFGDAKPACAKCVVHCYNAAMREQVRIVMRWAGPRMLGRHPVLAVRHLLAERRPVPRLPEKRPRKAGGG